MQATIFTTNRRHIETGCALAGAIVGLTLAGVFLAVLGMALSF